jgi:hypothetical protein
MKNIRKIYPTMTEIVACGPFLLIPSPRTQIEFQFSSKFDRKITEIASKSINYAWLFHINYNGNDFHTTPTVPSLIKTILCQDRIFLIYRKD